MSLDGAHLNFVDAAGLSVTLPAKGSKFTIGSYLDSDLVLANAERLHCEIQCDAFGRVTIRNHSQSEPISLNGQIVQSKRPLLHGALITILNEEYTWSFPKVSECGTEEAATPERLVNAVQKPLPNSSPSLKSRRLIVNRMTVHNFRYFINSDDEGNTSIESRNQSDGQLDVSSGNSDDAESQSDATKANAEVSPVTDDTVKVDILEGTQNKENVSTPSSKILLELCARSDLVITSFSPRETGVKIEKSFTAIVRPNTIAMTPKSVYSTPKSVLSELNDDSCSRDILDFTTPSTSKKALAAGRKSSMCLIDLTTPQKLWSAETKSDSSCSSIIDITSLDTPTPPIRKAVASTPNRTPSLMKRALLTSTKKKLATETPEHIRRQNVTLPKRRLPFHPFKRTTPQTKISDTAQGASQSTAKKRRTLALSTPRDTKLSQIRKSLAASKLVDKARKSLNSKRNGSPSSQSPSRIIPKGNETPKKQTQISAVSNLNVTSENENVSELSRTFTINDDDDECGVLNLENDTEGTVQIPMTLTDKNSENSNKVQQILELNPQQSDSANTSINFNTLNNDNGEKIADISIPQNLEVSANNKSIQEKANGVQDTENSETAEQTKTELEDKTISPITKIELDEHEISPESSEMEKIEIKEIISSAGPIEPPTDILENKSETTTVAIEVADININLDASMGSVKSVEEEEIATKNVSESLRDIHELTDSLAVDSFSAELTVNLSTAVMESSENTENTSEHKELDMSLIVSSEIVRSDETIQEPTDKSFDHTVEQSQTKIATDSATEQCGNTDGVDKDDDDHSLHLKSQVADDRSVSFIDDIDIKENQPDDLHENNKYRKDTVTQTTLNIIEDSICEEVPQKEEPTNKPIESPTEDLETSTEYKAKTSLVVVHVPTTELNESIEFAEGIENTVELGSPVELGKVFDKVVCEQHNEAARSLGKDPSITQRSELATSTKDHIEASNATAATDVMENSICEELNFITDNTAPGKENPTETIDNSEEIKASSTKTPKKRRSSRLLSREQSDVLTPRRSSRRASADATCKLHELTKPSRRASFSASETLGSVATPKRVLRLTDEMQTPTLQSKRLLNTTKPAQDSIILEEEGDMGTELVDTSTATKVHDLPVNEDYGMEIQASTLTCIDQPDKTDYQGMRELLKTPKGFSTPRFKGLREMMRTPKVPASPILDNIDELLEMSNSASSTPKRLLHSRQSVTRGILDESQNTTNDFIGLDKFFKTPRAKNIMIPNNPASAVLKAQIVAEKAATEYDLNATNTSVQLDKIFDDVETTEITSMISAEDTECELSVGVVSVANADDPLMLSTVQKSYNESKFNAEVTSGENNDTVASEILMNINTTGPSLNDPLTSTTYKNLEKAHIPKSLQHGSDSPNLAEMSGIQFLDQSSDSLFSEKLMVSGVESCDLTVDETNATSTAYVARTPYKKVSPENSALYLIVSDDEDDQDQNELVTKTINNAESPKALSECIANVEPAQDILNSSNNDKTMSVLVADSAESENTVDKSIVEVEQSQTNLDTLSNSLLESVLNANDTEVASTSIGKVSQAANTSSQNELDSSTKNLSVSIASTSNIEADAAQIELECEDTKNLRHSLNIVPDASKKDIIENKSEFNVEYTSNKFGSVPLMEPGDSSTANISAFEVDLTQNESRSFSTSRPTEANSSKKIISESNIENIRVNTSNKDKNKSNLEYTPNKSVPAVETSVTAIANISTGEVDLTQNQLKCESEEANDAEETINAVGSDSDRSIFNATNKNASVCVSKIDDASKSVTEKNPGQIEDIVSIKVESMCAAKSNPAAQNNSTKIACAIYLTHDESLSDIGVPLATPNKEVTYFESQEKPSLGNEVEEISSDSEKAENSHAKTKVKPATPEITHTVETPIHSDKDQKHDDKRYSNEGNHTRTAAETDQANESIIIAGAEKDDFCCSNKDYAESEKTENPASLSYIEPDAVQNDIPSANDDKAESNEESVANKAGSVSTPETSDAEITNISAIEGDLTQNVSRSSFKSGSEDANNAEEIISAANIENDNGQNVFIPSNKNAHLPLSKIDENVSDSCVELYPSQIEKIVPLTEESMSAANTRPADSQTDATTTSSQINSAQDESVTSGSPAKNDKDVSFVLQEKTSINNNEKILSDSDNGENSHSQTCESNDKNSPVEPTNVAAPIIPQIIETLLESDEEQHKVKRFSNARAAIENDQVETSINVKNVKNELSRSNKESEENENLLYSSNLEPDAVKNYINPANKDSSDLNVENTSNKSGSYLTTETGDAGTTNISAVEVDLTQNESSCSFKSGSEEAHNIKNDSDQSDLISSKKNASLCVSKNDESVSKSYVEINQPQVEVTVSFEDEPMSTAKMDPAQDESVFEISVSPGEPNREVNNSVAEEKTSLSNEIQEISSDSENEEHSYTLTCQPKSVDKNKHAKESPVMTKNIGTAYIFPIVEQQNKNNTSSKEDNHIRGTAEKDQVNATIDLSSDDDTELFSCETIEETIRTSNNQTTQPADNRHSVDLTSDDEVISEEPIKTKEAKSIDATLNVSAEKPEEYIFPSSDDESLQILNDSKPSAIHDRHKNDVKEASFELKIPEKCFDKTDLGTLDTNTISTEIKAATTCINISAKDRPTSDELAEKQLTENASDKDTEQASDKPIDKQLIERVIDKSTIETTTNQSFAEDPRTISTVHKLAESACSVESNVKSPQLHQELEDDNAGLSNLNKLNEMKVESSTLHHGLKRNDESTYAARISEPKDAITEVKTIIEVIPKDKQACQSTNLDTNDFTVEVENKIDSQGLSVKLLSGLDEMETDDVVEISEEKLEIRSDSTEEAAEEDKREIKQSKEIPKEVQSMHEEFSKHKPNQAAVTPSSEVAKVEQPTQVNAKSKKEPSESILEEKPKRRITPTAEVQDTVQALSPTSEEIPESVQGNSTTGTEASKLIETEKPNRCERKPTEEEPEFVQTISSTSEEAPKPIQGNSKTESELMKQEKPKRREKKPTMEVHEDAPSISPIDEEAPEPSKGNSKTEKEASELVKQEKTKRRGRKPTAETQEDAHTISLINEKAPEPAKDGSTMEKETSKPEEAEKPKRRGRKPTAEKQDSALMISTINEEETEKVTSKPIDAEKPKRRGRKPTEEVQESAQTISGQGVSSTEGEASKSIEAEKPKRRGRKPTVDTQEAAQVISLINEETPPSGQGVMTTEDEASKTIGVEKPKRRGMKPTTDKATQAIPLINEKAPPSGQGVSTTEDEASKNLETKKPQRRGRYPIKETPEAAQANSPTNDKASGQAETVKPKRRGRKPTAETQDSAQAISLINEKAHEPSQGDSTTEEKTSKPVEEEKPKRRGRKPTVETQEAAQAISSIIVGAPQPAQNDSITEKETAKPIEAEKPKRRGRKPTAETNEVAQDIFSVSEDVTEPACVDLIPEKEAAKPVTEEKSNRRGRKHTTEVEEPAQATDSIDDAESEPIKNEAVQISSVEELSPDEFKNVNPRRRARKPSEETLETVAKEQPQKKTRRNASKTIADENLAQRTETNPLLPLIDEEPQSSTSQPVKKAKQGRKSTDNGPEVLPTEVPEEENVPEPKIVEEPQQKTTSRRVRKPTVEENVPVASKDDEKPTTRRGRKASADTVRSRLASVEPLSQIEENPDTSVKKPLRRGRKPSLDGKAPSEEKVQPAEIQEKKPTRRGRKRSVDAEQIDSKKLKISDEEQLNMSAMPSKLIENDSKHQEPLAENQKQDAAPDAPVKETRAHRRREGRNVPPKNYDETSDEEKKRATTSNTNKGIHKATDKISTKESPRKSLESPAAKTASTIEGSTPENKVETEIVSSAQRRTGRNVQRLNYCEDDAKPNPSRAKRTRNPTAKTLELAVDSPRTPSKKPRKGKETTVNDADKSPENMLITTPPRGRVIRKAKSELVDTTESESVTATTSSKRGARTRKESDSNAADQSPETEHKPTKRTRPTKPQKDEEEPDHQPQSKRARAGTRAKTPASAIAISDKESSPKVESTSSKRAVPARSRARAAKTAAINESDAATPGQATAVVTRPGRGRKVHFEPSEEAAPAGAKTQTTISVSETTEPQKRATRSRRK